MGVSAFMKKRIIVAAIIFSSCSLLGTANQDDSLLVGEQEMEYPQKQQENNLTEWAMIDYKWIVQPTKTGESK